MTENLISANLWGIDSHGVGRYPVLYERLQKNIVNKAPHIKITAVPGALSVDGDNGLGAVVTMEALEAAMKTADTYGICRRGIKRSNHFAPRLFLRDCRAKRIYSTDLFRRPGQYAALRRQGGLFQHQSLRRRPPRQGTPPYHRGYGDQHGG
jgi:hypothetical protein